MISETFWSFYLPNYEIIEHWRKFGVHESEPDVFVEGVRELLGNIDTILEIPNWHQRTKSIVFDALERFDDYADGQYDSDNGIEEEDRQRSEMKGCWKEKLFDIIRKSKGIQSLVDDILDHISNGTNYDIVESALQADAKEVADEINAEKPNLVKLAACLRREIGLPVDGTEVAEASSPHIALTQPIARRLRSSDQEELSIAKRLKRRRSKV
jgi:hypothetical protein